VFLFRFSKERRCWVCPAISGKSCVKHDFRVDIDGGVEPDLLFVFELDLFLVDSNAIRFCGEVLIVMLGEGLVPVVNGGSGSADAEPLAEVATLRQRRCGSVSGARQPDQPGWRARPICVQKRYAHPDQS